MGHSLWLPEAQVNLSATPCQLPAARFSLGLKRSMHRVRRLRAIEGKDVSTLCFVSKSRRTFELTRRREFNQVSPDGSSCETRPRRSRPTICYVSPPNQKRASIVFFAYRKKKSTCSMRGSLPSKFIVTARPVERAWRSVGCL